MYSRREFLEKFSAGLKGAASLYFSLPFLLSWKSVFSKGRPDLVALRGGSGPDELFRRGISEYGGMGSFVKKGQTVLVKPNIGWDRTPEYGANTNPGLIGEIVRQCRNAGASKVLVMDHTCDPWRSCYKNSGISDAVKSAGGIMVPANAKSYYRKAVVKKGRVLKSVHVHRVYLDADVVINVPVLKNHSSTDMTASMKNLMGVVWDRYAWHRMNLNQCIADFASFRKPDLTVIDAYNVMTKNGPRGYSTSDIKKYRYLFISTDQVAADAASAMVLAGTDSRISKPGDVDYVRIAASAGLGQADLKKLNIKRIRI